MRCAVCGVCFVCLYAAVCDCVSVMCLQYKTPPYIHTQRTKRVVLCAFSLQTKTRTITTSLLSAGADKCVHQHPFRCNARHCPELRALQLVVTHRYSGGLYRRQVHRKSSDRDARRAPVMSFTVDCNYSTLYFVVIQHCFTTQFGCITMVFIGQEDSREEPGLFIYAARARIL